MFFVLELQIGSGWLILRIFIALGPHLTRRGCFFATRMAFFRVPGRSGLGFAPKPRCSEFFRMCGLDMRKCSELDKTLAGAAKIKVFYFLHKTGKPYQNI